MDPWWWGEAVFGLDLATGSNGGLLGGTGARVSERGFRNGSGQQRGGGQVCNLAASGGCFPPMPESFSAGSSARLLAQRALPQAAGDYASAGDLFFRCRCRACGRRTELGVEFCHIGWPLTTATARGGSGTCSPNRSACRPSRVVWRRHHSSS
ncbi:hypothetical protein B484DRAFT_458630 [Ochromonadaceae sp. CCMP2298]|nr:hypothetical protein B484DRAFT_458630 [Ochromonadaceae sp. CCMP2298]